MDDLIALSTAEVDELASAGTDVEVDVEADTDADTDADTEELGMEATTFFSSLIFWEGFRARLFDDDSVEASMDEAWLEFLSISVLSERPFWCDL